MSRSRLAFALFLSLFFVGLFVAHEAILRRQGSPPHAILAINQPQPRSPSVVQSAVNANSAQPGEPHDAVDSQSVPAPSDSTWKSYTSSEYGFEIKYPGDWEFDDNYENNYGKPPSGHGRPAYAGETRTLFNLEMDGPDQSHEGGGDFEDGAIIDVQITGTTGNVENWNITPSRSSYLQSSTPMDWVKLNSSLLGGDGSQTFAVDTNGFSGALHVACTGSNPCQLFGEEGGAYRTLPNGRVLLISWDRMVGHNDFSYQKYFLPMISNFRLLN